MTPWAVLLLRPGSEDRDISKKFRELSRAQHPDRDGANGVPGPDWYKITEAYELIKTEPARKSWEHGRLVLSNRCMSCAGSGVVWSRLGKNRPADICRVCSGEGRVARKGRK